MKSISAQSRATVRQTDKAKRILDAAYELFVESGDISPSISEIVKRAGVAKGTFYLYLDRKSVV